MSKQKSAETQPRMERKQYEKELQKLQTELCQLQEWVVHAGLRVIVVFEGRDAAGKGGAIKAIMERVGPRVFRVVALPAPSDPERDSNSFPLRQRNRREFKNIGYQIPPGVISRAPRAAPWPARSVRVPSRTSESPP
jgi:polyphosphate kinase 2 (PPK2 family)